MSSTQVFGVTGATGAATTVWQIDPSHTTVEFAVKHMMISTVKGQFSGVTGALTLDEADPSRSSVNIEIDAASLTTRDERRDGHLRSPDFLDAENYPKLSFVSTKVEALDGDRLRVSGDLTIRGITTPVVLMATYQGQSTSPWGMTVRGYSAETTINRTDFGLLWNATLETGGILVGESVKISLEIEAIRQ